MMGKSIIILCMWDYMLMVDFLQLKIVSSKLHSMYKMIEIYKFLSRNLNLFKDVFCLENLLLE